MTTRQLFLQSSAVSHNPKRHPNILLICKLGTLEDLEKCGSNVSKRHPYAALSSPPISVIESGADLPPMFVSRPLSEQAPTPDLQALASRTSLDRSGPFHGTGTRLKVSQKLNILLP